VCGAPFFDKWFEPMPDISSRSEFCNRLGLNPRHKILLYLGSSANIARDESWLVEAIKDVFERSDRPAMREWQILVRPHPANAGIYQRLSRSGIRVWPERGALPERRQQFLDLRTSLRHADAAVGINTSGMIDAVLAGAPTLSVRLPQYADTQSKAPHFRHLDEAGSLYITDSVEGLTATLGELSEGRDPLAEQREAFVKAFARPNGLERAAGDIVAEAAIDLAMRRMR
jgi:hypothetical protein